MDILITIVGILNLALCGVLLVLFLTNKARSELPKNDLKKVEEKLVKTDTKIEILSKKIDDLTPKISDEFRVNRKEISDNLSGISKTVDSRVKELQNSNEKKLEQMRETVDEKLKDFLPDLLQSDGLEIQKVGIGHDTR